MERFFNLIFFHYIKKHKLSKIILSHNVELYNDVGLVSRIWFFHLTLKCMNSTNPQTYSSMYVLIILLIMYIDCFWLGNGFYLAVVFTSGVQTWSISFEFRTAMIARRWQVCTPAAKTPRACNNMDGRGNMVWTWWLYIY